MQRPVLPMSDAPEPWARKVKPLPLPDRTATASHAAASAPDNSATDADDELDRLTSQYAAEAETKARDVAAKHAAARQPPQKGMGQLRKEGLATALPEDNKCVIGLLYAD